VNTLTDIGILSDY